MLGLALLFALLLDSRRTRAGSFSRIAIFLPYAVPGRDQLAPVGLPLPARRQPLPLRGDKLGSTLPSLLNPDLIIFAIANIALWGGVGFNMIVMYTSLKAVPQEIYEAAKLDGASRDPDRAAHQDPHHRPVRW